MSQTNDLSTNSAPTNDSCELGHPSFLTLRVTILSIVILPFIGFIAAFISLWGHGAGWVELGSLGTMYIITVLGITVGFHRLFTHRAFETNLVVQGILAILGSMAVQGPLLKWVALHRRASSIQRPAG